MTGLNLLNPVICHFEVWVLRWLKLEQQMYLVLTLVSEINNNREIDSAYYHLSVYAPIHTHTCRSIIQLILKSIFASNTAKIFDHNHIIGVGRGVGT